MPKIKKYAKMLLNTTGTEAVPGAINQLSTVNELLSESREFRGLFENPVFSTEEKARILRQLSDRLNLSEDIVRLILRLSEDRIISALPELINAATAIYLEKKKRAKAVVMTSIDTKGRHNARLASSLKQLTGRDIDIEYVIDPSLLGGVLIKVGSTMYDGSIKGQVRLLKDELLKEL